MRRLQLAATVTALVVLGGAIVLSARSEPQPPADTAPVRPKIQVATVDLSLSGRSLRLPGVTRAARRAALSFSIPGRITERPVEIGDRITAGQMLARLDDREFALAEKSATAALVQLEVRLAQSERDLGRVERLAKAHAATTEELEQTRAAAAALSAACDAASARQAEARRLLGEATLRAPFAGTVTAADVEPDEWCSPGQPIVELAGSGRIEVEVTVPESVHGRIQEGTTALVSLPFLGREVKGTVHSVAAAAGGSGGLFPVNVSLTGGEDVVPGLAADVELQLEARSRLTIPLAAIVDPGSSRPTVFRVAGGHVEQIEVRPGRVTGDRITVDGALAAGDRVVVVGQTFLADGDAVEVF